jgi:tRNA 5-methylaminomethyl-2-thiouridine biosynthesis bifunctional protein
MEIGDMLQFPFSPFGGLAGAGGNWCVSPISDAASELGTRTNFLAALAATLVVRGNWSMSPIHWTPEGPRSARFGDVYFSLEDGLAESRTVFLKGCGLPEAWAGRRRFVVGELGFGTGLNIAALLDLWRSERPQGGRLRVFSVEAFPLSRDEAGRALLAWPELAPVAGLLLDRWPPRAPGFHRLDLPELDASIDLCVGEAAQALDAWSGRADAWFLDGFAPSTNPEMWRDEVLALVAARSAPGARAATFTVAGSVRRGLAAQGFEVAKREGFGRKRERLEARLPGLADDPPRPASVAVVGAGIAGAALVRALRAEGLEPVLVEAAAPGAGASGNAAALVTPRLDAAGGALAAFSAQAFRRASTLYDAVPDAVVAKGVLQLEGQARDRARFDKIAALPIWDEGEVERLDAEAAGRSLGEPTDRGGLFLQGARVIEPEAVIADWLAGTPLARGRAKRLARSGAGWTVLDGAGGLIAEADAVILAAGWGLAALAPGLQISPVRGQATVAGDVLPVSPAAWGGYLIPTRGGCLFGATHDRGDSSTDVRAGDDQRNLETLAQVRPELAAALSRRPLEGRAAVRAATPDRLPLCGETEPGLFVLGGLGSRGFSFAPLLAEHIAASLAGAPSPLPHDAAPLIAADRFTKETEA